MKIRDRYITKTLLTYTLIVLLVWLSIYGFFNFLAELNSVGIENYTVLEAFKYIFFNINKIIAIPNPKTLLTSGCTRISQSIRPTTFSKTT